MQPETLKTLSEKRNCQEACLPACAVFGVAIAFHCRKTFSMITWVALSKQNNNCLSKQQQNKRWRCFFLTCFYQSQVRNVMSI